MPGQRAADDADVRRLRRQCHDAAPAPHSSRILTPQRQSFLREPPSRAHEDAEPVVTSAAVVAQVIRNRARQVTLERVLGGIDVQPLDSEAARRVGHLLASSRTSDVVDAALALLPAPGDEVMTSDPKDLRTLLPRRSIKITSV